MKHSATRGERFSTRIYLSSQEVSEFARQAGDLNPIHHDRQFARQTRFGRLIASGPQTSAMLMALTASHFSKRAAMLGLEFWFRFNAPVPADEFVRLDWLAVGVKWHVRLRGEIVDLRGRLVRSDGLTAVGAKGKVLIMEKL